MLDATRRLPGIRFQAEPPPPAIVLPRMDVAGFVGYATSGPLDVPVAIEDPVQFADVFGPDVELGWDAVREEPAHAALGPSVRSFFRNGGKRCFVVRVAGERARESETTFELPGVVSATRLEAGDDAVVGHGLLRARSPGSWADAGEVAVSVAATGLTVRSVSLAEGILDLTVPAGRSIDRGDLIRLPLRSGWTLLMTVASGAPEAGDLRVRADQVVWTRAVALPPAASGRAHWIGLRGTPQQAAFRVVDDGDVKRVRVACALERAPAEGAIVRLGPEGAPLWAQVQRRDPDGTGTLLDVEAVRIRIAPPARLPAPTRMAGELLELELWTRGAPAPRRLARIGFGRGHPRYVADLPTDAELYRDLSGGAGGGTELSRTARDPRFPLAGPRKRPSAYFPVITSLLPTRWLGARVPPPAAPTRDGLASFDAAHFLDPELRSVRTHALLAQADHLRLNEGHELRGVHALLGIDDVTLVAVPDAVQVGWGRPPRPTALETPPPEPEPEPDRSGRFDGCLSDELPTPILVHAAGGLTWPLPPEGATVLVEEAGDDAFESATELYRGRATQIELGARTAGRRWYRARYADARGPGSWSAAVHVGSAAPQPFVLRAGAGGPDPAAVAVHRAVLRMCAARGDVLALLSLPRHYREEQAAGHAEALRAGPASADDPALGEGEVFTFSYGAVYHPWLLASGEERRTELRKQPPDGAVAGQFARDAIARGAWIAPANRAYRDALAVEPELAADRRPQLLAAQVNVLERNPRGFLTQGADTLSRDPELRPVNVRRLLQLLRRLALRHGETYAFEPNGEALRRAAQRGFEAVLGALFRLGAFAGARPDEAFRVVTGSAPNPPASIDAGRLVVELKVAPSRPLEFLTVRLVRAGDGRVLVETI